MKFIDKICSDLLTETGELIVLHPATPFLSQRPGGNKSYNPTLDKIERHIVSAKFINGNPLFPQVSFYTPLSITHINLGVDNGGKISVTNVDGTKHAYDGIVNINAWGNYQEYFSIKTKVEKHGDYIGDRLIKKSSLTEAGYYIPTTSIRGHTDGTSATVMLKDNFYTPFTKDEVVLDLSSTKLDTRSIQSIWFATKREAENCLRYLKGNFARFCLSILKLDQHIHQGELKLIPYLDFKKEWSDAECYKHFKLTQAEIKFIEDRIPKFYD